MSAPSNPGELRLLIHQAIGKGDQLSGLVAAEHLARVAVQDESTEGLGQLAGVLCLRGNYESRNGNPDTGAAYHSEAVKLLLQCAHQGDHTVVPYLAGIAEASNSQLFATLTRAAPELLLYRTAEGVA